MIFTRINGMCHLVRQETGQEPRRIYLGWEELESLKERCTHVDYHQLPVGPSEQGQVGLYHGIPVFEVKTQTHCFVV